MACNAIFTHGPQMWNRGSTDGLFLLLLLLLHTTNFGGWVGLYCTVYCPVLYCTVLYCIVLYCTVLYCTVLYCTVQYHTVNIYIYIYILYIYIYPIPPKKNPPLKKNPPPKKNSPPPPPPKKKKIPPQNIALPPKTNFQNNGGLNCTVDRGSCTANALLFSYTTWSPG